METDTAFTPAQLEEYRWLKAEKAVRDAGIPMDGITKASRSEMQQQAAVSLIHKNYDIIRVEDGDILYYTAPKSTTSYSRLDGAPLANVIKEAYISLRIGWTGSKIEDTAKTLKYSVPLSKTIKHIDTTLIEVCPGYFWDMQIQQFTDAPTRPCFVRLFDSGEHTPVVDINFNSIKKGDILISYRSAKAWLNSEYNPNHTLPSQEDVEEYDPDDPILKGNNYPAPVNIYFPFIDVWACHNHDTYMDIMKMIASIFMRRKPLGTFILTGVSRNGKGTAAKMIHTLLGEANTSKLRLTDLSKPRLNHTLATTLFNAPDEDVDTKKMTDEDIANWKSMASHEDIILEVYYSQQPRPISTNFVSLSPMNAIPKWKGTHATACQKRSLVIGFNADLSRFDNSGGKSFEEETFTPEMFSALLGTVLALSEYHSEHGLKFSAQMTEDQEALDESYLHEYTVLFTKFFAGYQDIRDVYNDYAMYVRNNNGLVTTLDALKLSLRQSGKNIARTSSPLIEGKIYKFKKAKGQAIFARTQLIPGSGNTIENYLYGGASNPSYDFDGAQKSVVSFLEKSDGG